MVLVREPDVQLLARRASAGFKHAWVPVASADPQGAREVCQLRSRSLHRESSACILCARMPPLGTLVALVRRHERPPVPPHAIRSHYCVPEWYHTPSLAPPEPLWCRCCGAATNSVQRNGEVACDCTSRAGLGHAGDRVKTPSSGPSLCRSQLADSGRRLRDTEPVRRVSAGAVLSRVEHRVVKQLGGSGSPARAGTLTARGPPRRVSAERGLQACAGTHRWRGSGHASIDGRRAALSW
jgi:hypothetical protein